MLCIVASELGESDSVISANRGDIAESGETQKARTVQVVEQMTKIELAKEGTIRVRAGQYYTAPASEWGKQFVTGPESSGECRQSKQALVPADSAH